MSKQKSNEPETAKEVTENLIEQTELEGMSQPEITESTSNEVVPDVIEEPAVPKNKKLNPKINTVATTTVKGDKKMGVYKFLSIYPQDIYISTLLKHYYPHSFFTKDEWFQRIDEMLSTPIYK